MMGIICQFTKERTPAQRALLRAWGCDQMQGYHYGRPMPAPDASSFILQDLNAIRPGRAHEDVSALTAPA